MLGWLIAAIGTLITALVGVFFSARIQRQRDALKLELAKTKARAEKLGEHLNALQRLSHVKEDEIVKIETEKQVIAERVQRLEQAIQHIDDPDVVSKLLEDTLNEDL